VYLTFEIVFYKIPARNSDSPPRLVNVKNVTNNGERSWLIELTTDDCTAPAADFSLDVSALTGSLSRADVTKVQAHSDQIAGNVVLNVRDQQIVFR
jgi:hypothetical protein